MLTNSRMRNEIIDRGIQSLLLYWDEGRRRDWRHSHIKREYKSDYAVFDARDVREILPLIE